MADQAAATYHHGEMPVVAHTSTYMRVMGLFKWGALGVADLLLLLTLWFCTPAGLGSAVIVAILVLALGVFALRSRKTAAH
jgi:hypothetical protein